MTASTAVRFNEQKQGGAFQLPPAWTVRATVAEVVKENHLNLLRQHYYSSFLMPSVHGSIPVHYDMTGVGIRGVALG
jgi:hypothetical protein